MIRLNAKVTSHLDGSLQGLHQALQYAIELEHATIPAYLYALYSLDPNKNALITKLVHSVIVEEMLHMSLACNILNAVGGEPVIDKPDFIPIYPCPLPGGVESELIVPLKPFSIELVETVFMEIEQPEDPPEYPDLATVASADAAGPITIGKYYKGIMQQIINLSQQHEIFTGNSERQLTKGLLSSKLITVRDVESACKAIETIVEQGEGTQNSPFDAQHELAHFFRFAEIVHGKALITNPKPPPPFIYGGSPIPFDPSGVYPVVSNPSTAIYASQSFAAYKNDTFNYTYTSMLKSLQQVFNGKPHQLPAAIGLMESLKGQAVTMMSSIPASGGLNAGPSFEYSPINRNL